MTTEELYDKLKLIQKMKCETQNLELKSAEQGCPKRLYDSLSSFSNQDDGGIIVFGIDEKQDYKEVGVYDAQDIQKKINEQCLQMNPVVRPLITVVEKENKKFVSAEIPGIDLADRGTRMNIQIFGTKKSFDSKKAERFFKERGIKYQFVDMKEKGLSKGEFNSVCQAVGGYEKLIDQECKDKDLLALITYLAEEDKAEKILENQKVIKTPIVRNGKQATVGYQPDVWKNWK